MAKSQRNELRPPQLGQPAEVSPVGDKLDWDELLGMAKEIFMKLVGTPSAIQRTPESLAEQAFEKAAMFLTIAQGKRHALDS